MQEALELLEFPRVLEICAREASSELGQREVLNSAPFAEIEDIRRELSLVEEMARLLGGRALPIQGLSDISAALKKLTPEGSTLDREEFLPFNDVLQSSSQIHRFFDNQAEDFPGLKALTGQLGIFDDLTKAIGKVFDPTGEIRDGASPELRRIRRQIESENRRMREITEKVFKQWKKELITREDELAFREGRLLIPVKSEHRGRISGVIQDESATGATLFVEPMETISCGNVIRRLQNEERREILRILLELCDRIRTRLAEIKESLEILSALDRIYAKGRFSRRLNCTTPQITKQAIIQLMEARHPLLALKEETEVVPLSLTLGDSQGSVLVITGPNAGGKTVALKTVGLLCSMAICGFPIPAKEGSEIPHFSSIHCDIGDPQSLDQDLSTFTSHLIRLRNALQEQNHPKLVLLDEIGSGTDPAEGSSIARAALLELRRQGALVVATTHHGTLKVFAHETEGIFNGSMQFDQETLQPTFRFTAGIPGSSYALEISARVGLPEVVTSEAKRLLGEQTSRLEDLLATLNESLRVSEEARREAELKRTEMEALKKLYSDRLTDLKTSEKEKLQQAAREAKEILKDANKRIEAAVKLIKEEHASKEAILKAHEIVRDEKKKVDQVQSRGDKQESKGEKPPSKVFQVGDWVRLEGLKDPVRISALRKDDREARLEVGGVHIWMDSGKLSPTRPPEAKVREADISISMTKKGDERPGYEIDLRGMTGDEAAFTLEEYLSDCLISGWKSLRIIHGKGTGVVRSRVQEVLKNYPGVKSSRFGRPDEGEFGVTIVELE